MRILVIAHEFPYPPNHGGRADVWNKINALKQRGHEIILFSWVEVIKGDLPSEHDLDTVSNVVNEMILIPIRRDLVRVLNLIRYPSFVAGRILGARVFKSCFLRVKLFNPEAVFAEGVYCAKVAQQFSKFLDLPFGIRTHNREYEYMYGQLRLSKNLKQKISIFMALMHLKKFEENMISSCNVFFDISLSDLEYWKLKGFSHGVWLPPITLKTNVISVINPDFEFDISFLGNLNSPNNVDGIIWFVTFVLPGIKQKLPNVRVLVMGSNPSEIIEKICLGNDIILMPNPNNPETLQSKSAVLINPVQFGSGVNIKTIDMLFSDNQVVTTSIGVQGLQREVEETFFVCDSPSHFAKAIIEILINKERKDVSKRDCLRSSFGISKIDVIEEAFMGLKLKLSV